MERRQDIPCRGIPNHLCRYSILNEMGQNSSLLNYRLHFQQLQSGKGMESNLTREKPNETQLWPGDQHYISINSNKLCGRYGIYPSCDIMRMPLSSVALFPQTHNPRFIMRKTSDKSQMRHILQRSLTSTSPQKLSRSSKIRKPEKLSQPRGVQENMTTKHNGNQEKKLGKN